MLRGRRLLQRQDWRLQIDSATNCRHIPPVPAKSKSCQRYRVGNRLSKYETARRRSDLPSYPTTTRFESPSDGRECGPKCHSPGFVTLASICRIFRNKDQSVTKPGEWHL